MHSYFPKSWTQTELKSSQKNSFNLTWFKEESTHDDPLKINMKRNEKITDDIYNFAFDIEEFAGIAYITLTFKLELLKILYKYNIIKFKS